MFKDPNKISCFTAVLLGLLFIGVGAFLLASSFTLKLITIGLMMAGILLLIIGCLGK